MDTEYQRIVLSAYSNELKKAKVLNRVLINPNGEFVLQVEVPGPFNSTADFRLDNSFSYIVNSATLTGIYKSDLLTEPIIESWTINESDDPAIVSLVLIQEFIEECVYKEHENMVEVELVTDDNLEEFAMFLNDDALRNEDIYAIGLRMRDVETSVTAGAASFYLSDDNLVIDNIEILSEYQGLGIEEYVVSYIQKTMFE